MLLQRGLDAAPKFSVPRGRRYWYVKLGHAGSGVQCPALVQGAARGLCGGSGRGLPLIARCSHVMPVVSLLGLGGGRWSILLSMRRSSVRGVLPAIAGWVGPR